MNEEVNAIINNLCDKLGTTAERLIPEIARLRTVESAVMLIIGLATLAVGLYFLPKAWKYDHRKSRDYLDESIWVLIPSAIVFGGFIWTVICIHALVGWLASPKAKAVLEIIRMVKR